VENPRSPLLPPSEAAPIGAAPAAAGGRPREKAPLGAPASPKINTLTHAGLTWVDIREPGAPEIAWLRVHYPTFHALHFEDVLSHYQRPKLDVRPDYLFMVAHFPFVKPQTRAIVVSEVDLFIGPDYIITAHAAHLLPLRGLWDRVRDIPETRAAVLSGGPAYLLYMILDPLVDCCFPLLHQLDEKIEHVEDLIFGGDVRQTVYEISALRRDIIAFRHVIRPEVSVFVTLEGWARAHPPPTGEDFGEHFSDLNDHLAKIVGTLDDQKDVIEGLNDTNNSLTNAHINNVIKLLTIFSVILLPMSVIASIYGMNFDVLPGEKNPYGFWITMAAMIAVASAMLVYFKWRRWM
jgi:magnesium transporter